MKKKKKLLADLTAFAMTATMLLSPVGSMGIRADERGVLLSPMMRRGFLIRRCMMQC